MLRSLDLSRTVLIEENALYLEDPRTSGVDLTGSRHEIVNTTGFASTRVTADLALTASGK
jgi:hypothetical protein